MFSPPTTFTLRRIPHLRSMLVVFGFAAALARTTALANDAMAGGSGSDLVPLSTDRVRMVAEDILIRDIGGKRDPQTGSPIMTCVDGLGGQVLERVVGLHLRVWRRS